VRPADTSITKVLPLSTDNDLRLRFMVVNDPVAGNIRFGLLLEELDKLAEEVAVRHARRTSPDAYVVTGAVDDIWLRTPGDVTRDFVLHARLNWVGRSSMELGIRVEQPDGTSEPSHVASCYFTMVARVGHNDQAHSVGVEPLEYGDTLDQRRRDEAIERRAVTQRGPEVRPPTRDEYELLTRLHTDQDRPDFAGMLAAKLSSLSWERMYPMQENVPHRIFGGFVMRRAYELASMQAEEIATGRPVIVRVNRINFLQPVRIGDKLRFVSRVVYTGQTSICVEVSIERISRDRVTKSLSNTCVFTFVNVDDRMTPKPVPPVYPTTYAEDARYLDAHRRHEQFKARRRNGTD
jgi:acyl-CoA hydrolase